MHLGIVLTVWFDVAHSSPQWSRACGGSSTLLAWRLWWTECSQLYAEQLQSGQFPPLSRPGPG
jgi:hypothetical protein